MFFSVKVSLFFDFFNPSVSFFWVLMIGFFFIIFCFFYLFIFLSLFFLFVEVAWVIFLVVI